MTRRPSFILNHRGTNIIEILIAITLLAVLMALSMQSIPMAMRQAKQESKIIEGQMERVIGLDLFRDDIEHAGFGLFWSTETGTINYLEAKAASGSILPLSVGAYYNDAPSGVPRPIILGRQSGLNNSDYLVVKATSVGRSESAQKWTYSIQGAPRVWAKDMFANDDRVVVMKPSIETGKKTKELIIRDGSFYFRYGDVYYVDFSPFIASSRVVIYGVDPDTDLRMPFNRADYYVTRPQDSADMPVTCAPNTGILYKSTVNQGGDGSFSPGLPILDCVALMKIVFLVDTNDDGIADSQTTSMTSWTAEDIRNKLKEVLVYILTHEGARDTAYRFPNSTIVVAAGTPAESTVALNSVIGTSWPYYRWKVITMSAKPKNLYW